MSDERPYRRLRRTDRKHEIKAEPDFLNRESADDLPDLTMLSSDQEDVAQLSSLPDGLVARSLKITPPEQRYPPVSPPPEPPRTRPVKTAVSAAPVPPRARRPWNLLTLLMLLATVGVWATVAAIWQDPYSLLNPLPPPIVRVFVTATFLPPTPGLAATVAPPPAVSGVAGMPAGVQYRSNANGRGCDWASIAGTVTTPTGSPLVGYRVQITGETVTATAFSGTASAFGESGFELSLGATPLADSYLVQLVSPEGNPLSDLVAVETRATCEENVAVLDFVLS